MIKYGFVVLLLIMLMVGNVSATTNENVDTTNITINEGEAFTIELKTDPWCEFYQFWEPTYDTTYFSYEVEQFYEKHIFKALKPGQKTINMTLYQCGTDQWGHFPRWIKIKTITYNINIQKQTNETINQK